MSAAPAPETSPQSDAALGDPAPRLEANAQLPNSDLTAQNAAAALNPRSDTATPPLPLYPSSSHVQGLKSIALRVKQIMYSIRWKGNIGTIATVLSLVAAMVYGPPAWKLAQAQVTLAIQGMRLSQWATCADHSEIQNSTTCRNILSTDFDVIAKRSLRAVTAGLSSRSLTVMVATVPIVLIMAWVISVFYRSYKSQPKLSNTDQAALSHATHFSITEIQDWYKGFMKDTPKGFLTLEDFQRMYRTFFPFGAPDAFAALVFKHFDTDRSGHIDFGEFLMALSTTSRGSMEEKCLWAFGLYDVNENGKISYNDMLTVVRAIYEMVGEMVELPENEATPELRVARIWSTFDIDADGTMSKVAFIQGSRGDPTIVEALSLYHGLI